MNQGVADPRLTTWLLRHEYSALSILFMHLSDYTKSYSIRQVFSTFSALSFSALSALST